MPHRGIKSIVYGRFSEDRVHFLHPDREWYNNKHQTLIHSDNQVSKRHCLYPETMSIVWPIQELYNLSTCIRQIYYQIRYIQGYNFKQIRSVYNRLWHMSSVIYFFKVNFAIRNTRKLQFAVVLCPTCSVQVMSLLFLCNLSLDKRPVGVAFI